MLSCRINRKNCEVFHTEKTKYYIKPSLFIFNVASFISYYFVLETSFSIYSPSISNSHVYHKSKIQCLSIQ